MHLTVWPVISNVSYFMNQLLRRIWNSPTIMTWGSFLMRTASFFLVLPLVLTKLSTEEIVVWYLFSTILSLQWLLDMGFGSTFSRAISYAMGGVTHIRSFKEKEARFGDGRPNWDHLARVVSSMRTIYVWLALGAAIIIGGFGTWALVRPISHVPASEQAWFAWGLILAVYPISFGPTFMPYIWRGSTR